MAQEKEQTLEPWHDELLKEQSIEPIVPTVHRLRIGNHSISAPIPLGPLTSKRSRMAADMLRLRTAGDQSIFETEYVEGDRLTSSSEHTGPSVVGNECQWQTGHGRRTRQRGFAGQYEATRKWRLSFATRCENSSWGY